MYKLKQVPFLKVRVVLDSEENPREFVLKRIRLYNLVSKVIGSSIIIIEKDGKERKVEKDEPVVRTSLDYFCGQYMLNWFANGEPEDNQIFTIVLSESKMNTVEMAKKVFAFENDIRRFEKVQSDYFDAKRISNFSMGEQAEKYAIKAEAYKQEMEALYKKLEEEGIIRENFIYTPMYMYIFPRRKMEESYYRRANFFKIKWLTPNVCITPTNKFFKKYCEMSRYSQ